MKVRIKTAAVTNLTRIVLLPGTVGQVLEVCRRGVLIVDFGLVTAVSVPENSHLIEVLTREDHEYKEG